jgi:signal transduction histidine kinase
MRRGPKPAKANVEAKPPIVRKSRKREGSRVRDLEKRLAEALKREEKALEQQAATAEILRVISQSQTDLQPVFEAIVRSAAQLCEATFAALHRFDGQVITFEAHHGMTEQEAESSRHRFPLPTERGTAVGRAILDRRTTHIHDIRRDPEYRVRAGRREVQPFSEKQINLVETFADQAVIAIENVRLFKESQEKNHALTEAHAQVTESLERQTATSEILSVISSSPTDAQPVFEAIVRSAVRLCNARFANVFRLENDVVHLVAHHNVPFEALEHFRRTFPQPLSQGGTLTAQAMRQGTVVQIHDVEAQSDVAAPVRALTRSAGYRTVLAVPILRPGNIVGAIGVGRSDVTGAPRPFSDKEVALLRTFADQAVIAIENVRLFKELEVANRELEAASQHKSEFLANMSHELRTPLNAIIGFSEVLTERMFGDLNEKQEEYLKDIYASGTHLLSLINDILDLSKIEAGRMELELTDFDLPQAIDNALILVRERAGRRGIVLEHSVNERLGEIRGDERKIKQVLLNLLSNALKFTPEGGRVEVRAGMVDSMAEISVTDTGVGIAPADQEAVFEEFRQVGTAEKKAEGTGLGLTLCRKFVELHGGRIRVTSQVGVGSTFTFTIPDRRGE